MTTSYNDMTKQELAKHIEEKYHAYLRENLPRTSELLYTVLSSHGSDYHVLFEVYSLFGQLRAILEQHLLKEETLLFSKLGHGNNAFAKKEIAIDLMKEHDRTRHILNRLKDITNGYDTTNILCSDFKQAYVILNTITQDLLNHYYLEETMLLKEFV